MESLHQTVTWINAVLSDYVLTVLLIGCGVFFSIRTRFVQFRCFGEGLRNALGGAGGRGHAGISPFQSLMAAVAAQVGTGNIVGASGAILIGGPGAIFWMWIIASFGMATIYAEAVLAQKSRVVTPDGSIEGGPVYYIRKAFPGRLGIFLAGSFAVVIIVALGCVGCMVQVNSIAATCRTAFGIPPWVTGAALAACAGLVLPGAANDDADDAELRVAFDFDGVVADDSAEKIYQTAGIKAFYDSETANAERAISPGPLGDLFRKLGHLRALEDEREEADPGCRRFLKTAIVTARSAPAHRRVIHTLRSWNITVDETHFLGGMDKGRILETLRPHIFFDDQKHPHLDSARNFTPSVHIPFGAAARN